MGCYNTLKQDCQNHNEITKIIVTKFNTFFLVTDNKRSQQQQQKSVKI